jgi:hypothetical protein
VERVAVQLRDEPVLRPVQVDLVTLHDAVAGGLRQTVLAEEAAQPAFEPRSRRRRSVQQAPEVAGRPGLQVLEPHELAHQRLGERGVELIEGERLREVEQCAEGRGDRDPPVDGHVPGVAGRDEVIDRPPLQTGAQQLPPRDDPMLRLRDRRHPEWSRFARYRGVNRLHPARIARPA